MSETITHHDGAGRPHFSVIDEQRLARARGLVALWRSRLGIAERIDVELFEDDGQGDREEWAKCLPLERDGEGLWSFTLGLSDTVPDDLIEETVVHELVHVLVEPLRETYLGAKAAWLITTVDPHLINADQAKVGDYSGKLLVAPPGTEMKPVIPPPALETWETVIERIADAFLFAYR
ncbi:MAG TPA: hypothetical protein VGS01_09715 [Candidatus Limnocylindria bacterium]|jgi:hypothetical protein|nr:hypothetical protein [Candidatus Limnocylindria bacterium]